MIFVPRLARRLLTAAVLVGSGAVIAGCGASSSRESNGTSSLIRAANLSSKAVGYKVAMHTRENVNFTTIDMTGHGTFNAKGDDGAMVMNMSVAGHHELIDFVFAHNTYYMKFPPALLGRIGAVTPWVSFSLTDIGKYAKIPGFASLVGDSQSSNRSSAQYLDYLKATRGGSVKNLGNATVNGVETTHYQAAFNLTDLPKSVPPSERPAARQLAKVLQQRYHADYHPFNVWIDQAGLVRKFAMDFSESVQGHIVGVAMDLEYQAYGPQPAPHIPPASQDTDMMSLVNNGG